MTIYLFRSVPLNYKRSGFGSRPSNINFDDKQMIVNPVYANDEDENVST